MFAVFNGEAWGYLGSRKFLQELDEGAASVNGISSLKIDQVSARKINTGRDSLRLQLIIFLIFQTYINPFSSLFWVLCHDICFLQSLSANSNEFSFRNFTDSFESQAIYISV